MKNTIFENSYEKYLKELKMLYDSFLKESFSKKYYNCNSDDKYDYQRIKWGDFKEARKLEDFNKTGLYIWGVDKTILYIGKAEKSVFKKRFSRYVGSKKSQCAIAQELHSKKRKLSVEEIMHKYKVKWVRAEGAKMFAEFGIDNLWFIIIPFNNSHLIYGLENSIISAEDLLNPKSSLINTDKPHKTL